MAMARWQASVTDAAGNVVPGAMVEVRREGGGLVQLYSDRAGTIAKGNPFAADSDGFAFFHAPGGAYRVRAYAGAFERIWRYVAVGLGGESDLTIIPLDPSTPQVAELADRDPYDDEAEGFRVIVSDTGDGRAALYTMGGGGSGDWSDPAYITADTVAGVQSSDSSVTDIRAMTQAEYDALDPVSVTTFYIITE